MLGFYPVAGAPIASLPAGGSTTQSVLPGGITPVGFGSLNIYNAYRLILPGGIAPNPLTGPNALREVPSPTIDLRTKYLLPGSIAPPVTQFGTHYVAFYYQFIDQAGLGSGPETFGTQFIAYRYRYVYPTFIVSEAHGATKVSRKIFVYPSGFGGETFPTTHTIEPRVDRIYPNTGSTEQARYGVASLRNEREFLYVTNNYWVAEQFSTPKVYNQTQELFVGQYENTSADPAGYGTHAVENRNRTVTTFGHQDSRFSFYAADVNNSARAISPSGFTTEWGDTLVAYRIRNVYPTGTDTSYLSPSAIVYNNARLLAPTGFRSDTVGVATVVNRNRTVSQYFPYGGESVGTAFIAYRIRYLGVFSLNDVPAAFPEIRHNPFPIAPVGIDSYHTGAHDVIEHFTVIAPKSVNVSVTPRIGEPYVQNRNKTIAPYAYEQTTFGVQSIQNYIRYVNPTLGDTSTFGLAYVADSRRSVGPTPFSSHVVSVFAQIRNVIPDPPGQQNVVTTGVSPGVTQVGSPTMSYLTLFPTAINDSRVGSHVVRTNSILVPSLPYDDYVGTPSLIAARYLYVKQIPFPASEGQGESDLFTPKPRVSPHTIYAPSSDQATTQAVANHGGITGQIIDRDLWLLGHFGTHRIESKNRAVYPIWNQFDLAALKTKWGSPFVDLKTRRVYPIAIRSFRAGNLSTNASQEVVDASVGVATLFGVATLYDPAYIPTIAPSGIAPLVISNIDITLLNRQVYPTGFDDNATIPTRWGVPMMGYTRRPEFQGYIATQWGVPRVEYRNRFLHPVGNDMFLSANTLYGFNKRMRVSRINPKVQPVGFQATMFGIATIT